MTLDATPEQLWPLIADTDRVNRLIGLPASERVEPQADLSRTIHSQYLGLPVTWREAPFEWVFERWHSVERVFEPPFPIARLITLTHLEPEGARRSRVTVRVDIGMRARAFGPPARLIVAQKMLRDLRAVYTSFAAAAAGFDPKLPPTTGRPQVNQARLAAGAEQLRREGIRQALIDRLVAHLATMDDRAVLHMRPFALADAWGEPRLEVLALCLRATRAGLLDLEWDVMCPNCRGASVRAPSLSDLTHEAHCPSCNIRYDLNFDESVELRLSVSPQIRRAEDRSYCVGGPGNTRHILAQTWAPAGGVRELRLRLPPGGYRLRTGQTTGRAGLVAREGATARLAQVRFTAGEVSVTPDELAPGEVTLALENATGGNLLIMLEQSAWSAQAASAALVTAHDEFRRWFSSELLAPGLGLAVRNLTFLFTDLKSSTMLYDTLGDAPAYARVRDHFFALREIAARHEGALVKTIGDAVMAVFPTADGAVAAALDIQHEFSAGAIARGHPALQIKIGLHRGPCIAVNANDLLDYFGATVNVAARVLSESRGGDLVLTTAVYDDPAVRRLLAGLPVEPFRCKLRGIRQEFTLYRVLPGAAGAAAPTAAPAELREG